MDTIIKWVLSGYPLARPEDTIGKRVVPGGPGNTTRPNTFNLSKRVVSNPLMRPAQPDSQTYTNFLSAKSSISLFEVLNGNIIH